MAEAIERLIELDERETVKQRERIEFLSLMDAMIEALPDALVVTDLDGKIVLFNERAEFMFGYRRSEIIGKLVEQLIPERSRFRHVHDRQMFNRYNLSRRTQTLGIGLNLVGIRSDGHEFPAEISLARMVAPNGILILASIRFSPRASAALTVDNPVPEREPRTDDAA